MVWEVTNTTGAGTLYYLHGDHLGSTSLMTCGNATCGTLGAVLTRQSYYPYGGVRVAGNLPTDKTFTGQISDASTGLQYFNARYYSGSLGRFVSADTDVPGGQGPQALNRYSYVLNSPLKYTDPSGHRPCDDTDENGQCITEPGWSKPQSRLDWISLIKRQFGITLSDSDKTWDTRNASLLYSSLLNISAALGGRLRSIVENAGVTFRWTEYVGPKEYYSETSLTEVEFQTIGSAALRQQNIYHEFGHVLDNLPGMVDIFSKALKNTNTDDPSWLASDGELDPRALIEGIDVDDPNYAGGADAYQHPSTDPIEQWADIFANYVAGNIDHSSDNPLGRDMYNWVTEALTTNLTAP